MSEPAVKQIVLASRPKGLPTRENFSLEEVPMPELPQGGLLLRVLYLSLDPYMRGRMDDRKSYAKPVDLGEVMTGESVCEVMASDQTGYGVGDIVLAPTGWRTHRSRLAGPCASWTRSWRRSLPDSASSACLASLPMRVSI
jgi:NADPH-dependent curcumin reductase